MASVQRWLVNWLRGTRWLHEIVFRGCSGSCLAVGHATPIQAFSIYTNLSLADGCRRPGCPGCRLSCPGCPHCPRCYQVPRQIRYNAGEITPSADTEKGRGLVRGSQIIRFRLNGLCERVACIPLVEYIRYMEYYFPGTRLLWENYISPYSGCSNIEPYDRSLEPHIIASPLPLHCFTVSVKSFFPCMRSRTVISRMLKP